MDSILKENLEDFIKRTNQAKTKVIKNNDFENAELLLFQIQSAIEFIEEEIIFELKECPNALKIIPNPA